MLDAGIAGDLLFKGLDKLSLGKPAAFKDILKFTLDFIEIDIGFDQADHEMFSLYHCSVFSSPSSNGVS